MSTLEIPRQESARVILDSINEYGDRLTTVEATMVRFVLAEINTHRSHSRNSASSRAIPIQKQLDRVSITPAYPLVWTSEQKGMQGGPPLEGRDLQDAMDLFEAVHGCTTSLIEHYLAKHPLDKGPRLHKSLLNRLLEPFMWHTVILSATDEGWNNFFQLRSSYYTDLAQPELMAVADMIYDAMRDSSPKFMDHDEWHTPYIREDDEFPGFTDLRQVKRKVSIARCARVSYLTHDGRRDIEEDLAMYERLISAEPPHSSPAEHVATPAWRAEETKGNFRGWHQARHHNH